MGSSVEQAFKSAFGDYLALSQDFFISGCIITTSASGSGTLYSISAGHVMWKGELMEVDAHSLLKGSSQVIWLDVQDDGTDTSPVLNTDGQTDFVLRRRHVRLRVGVTYPTTYMALTAPRKEVLDRQRNKGRWVPKFGMLPYSGPLTNFDTTGLGLAGTDMEGFAVCNGLNGTPDMRGLVAIGATNVPDAGASSLNAAVSGASTLGTVVGSDQVTIEADNLPEHQHDFTVQQTVPGGGADVGGGGAFARVDQSRTTQVNSSPNDPISVKQASYAVVWLMSIV